MKCRSRGLMVCVFAAVVLAVVDCRAQGVERANAGEKPNVLVIIPDDLGWSDVGYNGSFIKTPNIDRLVASGIRLDQHYVLPTCTPTRVSLMTGKYPSRYGVLGPDYGEVIDRGDPTMASILAEGGYRTAIAGKWHMGSAPHTPMKYGFQSSYGYFDGQIDPYTHEYKDGRKSWHRNDTLVDEPGHATDLITQEAVRVIQSESAEPFFLYVAYSVPHYPLDEPSEWTSLYDELNLFPSRKLFAASVTHMDAGIGKIIEALEETGQRKNTLILFISDNGGQQSWHDREQYHGKYANKPHAVLGSNFPLRGWKTDVYEGGIRVPAIANWPGHLASGVIDMPMHVSDWLPTICSLTENAQVLKKMRVDGRNIWPQLMGERPAEARKFYWKTRNMSAVRDGDWKLIETRRDGQSGWELFNLGDDFRETTELGARHPEKLAELKALLRRFEEGDRAE